MLLFLTHTHDKFKKRASTLEKMRKGEREKQLVEEATCILTKKHRYYMRPISILVDMHRRLLFLL
jgi:hypothetical protein